MQDFAIIIPCLDPTESLVDLISRIKSSESEGVEIIIVNDGSSSEYDCYFEKALEFPQVTLLSHSHNYGKGKALKTAFVYVLDNLPKIEAVVTIDSDGQHTYDDMLRCMSIFYKHSDSFIFGAREFRENESVPMKSKIGNLFTSKFLKWTIGIDLQDTQTGLRVFGRQYLESLLRVDGDRFEYEMNVILFAKENNIPIIEVPIKTIYHNENKGTHFKVISDSFKIYQPFLKYGISSISSFSVDIILFSILLKLIGFETYLSITFSTIVARIISSLTNYTLNRHWVFKASSKYSGAKYFILVIIQMFLSSAYVSIIAQIWSNGNTTFIKIIVDSILFLISYLIQKHYVFNKGK